MRAKAQFCVRGNKEWYHEMEGKERYLLQWGKGTASYEATVFLRDTEQIPWILRLLFSNLKREELLKMTTINSTKGASSLHNARYNSTV